MTRGIRSAHLRVALAGVAMIDLVSFYVFIGEARERALGGGSPLGPFVATLSRAPVRAVIIVIGIAGALAFARGAGRLVAGLVPLVALMVLSGVHARLYGSPWRHLYYSGLCLSGWLAGLAVSRAAGTRSDESYARIGAIALLGTAYLNAAISKLAFSGLEWISGAPIQAVVVSQDGLVRDGLLAAYRSWVVMSPVVVGFFSLATVVFELAGPLMILGGATRPIVALGLLGMHSNIYLLTDILYWESMVLLVLLGVLPYDEPTAPRATVVPVLGSRGAFVGSAVTLGVAALLAIAHQRLRSDAPAAGGGGADVRPVHVADQRPPARRIGPFSVGERVTDGWSIEALTTGEGGFGVTVIGPAGRARFDVNCTDVEHRSPFDLGSAHVFYSGNVPLPVLQPIGDALRDRIRAAAEPREPCRAVNDWVTSPR